MWVSLALILLLLTMALLAVKIKIHMHAQKKGVSVCGRKVHGDVSLLLKEPPFLSRLHSET